MQKILFVPRRLYGWFATSLSLCIALMIPFRASAHVKWFCAAADVRVPPLPIASVTTVTFLAVGSGFAIMVFAGFVADGIVARRWPFLATFGNLFAATEEKLVRAATGAFFLLLWDKGAVVLWERGSAILTPELTASLGWVGLVQFLIALSVVWRRGCLVAAIGILVLYAYGITQFGVFHMVDYIFFPGIAAYLALGAIGTPKAIAYRVPFLSGGLAFGLMWTAVEKFVYPQWTLQIVALHPNLAFGFQPEFAVVVAGFVEFTLAFFIMTGRGLVRFGAAFYALIFLAAVPTFGHLDAVGHIPIVGILIVVCLHGASRLQFHIGILEKGRIANALAISAVYVASLIGFGAMYYGLHGLEYGHPLVVGLTR